MDIKGNVTTRSDRQNRDMNRQDGSRIYVYISCLFVIGAFLVACMISFLSEYGKHPDEFDVRLCLDWCMNRWIWPDMRQMGVGLGDTYSGYGFTKVCNYTPYFLIFSKISYVFKQFMGNLPYYRMPNLLLMAVLIAYIIRKIRDNNWLMLGFGICVQAWYIFSYVTADAEDFLLAFLAAAMLADKDSLLWMTLDAGAADGQTSENDPKPARMMDRHCVFRCIGLGIMYGLILLGKPYYYATLFLTFIVLMYHLIKTGINNRKTLICRYVLIAGVAFAILGGRALLDFHYYGFDKAEAKAQMAEMYSDYDKNPTTPIEDQTPMYRMASKGYTLPDMFRLEPKWFALSYKSFAAASIYYEGHLFYFTIIGLLYVVIYSWMGIYLCRHGEIPAFVFCTLLNIGSVVASILFSYLKDCQPQGRYLLQMVLTTCYLGSRATDLWKNRAFRSVVLAASCVSLLFFGLVETRKLIDLGYVRNLLSL